jgi:hypothetical protein
MLRCYFIGVRWIQTCVREQRLVLRSKLTLNRDFVDRIVFDNYAAERSPSFKLMLGLCARGMANDDQEFGSLESLLFNAVNFSRKPSQLVAATAQ